MKNSLFFEYSNVCNNRNIEEDYDFTNCIKPKLLARQEIEKEFNYMDIELKYDLVKDVIRSMSGDNKDIRFANLFYSTPDETRLLLNSILKGDKSIEDAPEVPPRESYY